MRNLFLALSLCLAVGAQAQQLLNRFDWAEMAQGGADLPGERVNENGRDALRVENTNDTQLTVRLATISEPSITRSYYAVRGEIKYADVQGDGFLEMWNTFPPRVKGGAEGKYFSRTLGESGEMGKISGTSDWRSFMLPFHADRTAPAPTELEVNLILPGPGVVFIGPLELVEYPGGAHFGTLAHAWWSDRTGGLFGGVLGAVIGCTAGLFAWLAGKGRASDLVLAGSRALIALGAILAVLGLVAIFARQPYGVWFPLLLCGALILLILPGRLRMFRQMYEQKELRRMEAADTI